MTHCTSSTPQRSPHSADNHPRLPYTTPFVQSPQDTQPLCPQPPQRLRRSSCTLHHTWTSCQRSQHLTLAPAPALALAEPGTHPHRPRCENTVILQQKLIIVFSTQSQAISQEHPIRGTQRVVWIASALTRLQRAGQGTACQTPTAAPPPCRPSYMTYRSQTNHLRSASPGRAPLPPRNPLHPQPRSHTPPHFLSVQSPRRTPWNSSHRRRTNPLHSPAEFIIFNAQSLAFNAQFLGFNTDFIIYTHDVRRARVFTRCAGVARTF